MDPNQIDFYNHSNQKEAGINLDSHDADFVIEKKRSLKDRGQNSYNAGAHRVDEEMEIEPPNSHHSKQFQPNQQ